MDKPTPYKLTCSCGRISIIEMDICQPTTIFMCNDCRQNYAGSITSTISEERGEESYDVDIQLIPREVADRMMKTDCVLEMSIIF